MIYTIILTWIGGFMVGIGAALFISRRATEPDKNEKVTRFEVIDEKGRAYTKWDCKIELSYQDEGRTLKVFVNNEK